MTATKRSGIWKWLLVLVVLGGGLTAWYWYQKGSKEAPLEFKTATVARGDIIQVVTANGQISPVKSVTVGSQVSGIITDIRVDFNSQVTNGQVVAQIDPSTYQQNITQSDADLANAQAASELMALNMRRAKELRAAELIPVSDYDKAVADLHQAEAVVKMREAALKKSKVDLERTTIYAPIDGMVISRVVDVGQTVAASLNAPTLFTIANDLRNMRIEAMVSEADVGGVQDGQQVTFTVDAFPGRKFRGNVTQVRYAPVTNQNVVNYISIVEVNNADLKLRPGMTANASIVTAQRRDVLRVPNAALRFRPPEGSLPKSSTNAPGAGPGQTALAGGGPSDASSPRSAEGSPPSSPEERRKRWESMTPEQRDQMRERMRSGGMGSGGPRANQDGPATRTVYVLEKETASGQEKPMVKLSGVAGWFNRLGPNSKEQQTLKPVTIKTGISDGSFTEVLEGLKEGDSIVIGVNLPAASASARPPTGASPFGGPFGGGMRPR